jgi:hypothetical protein
MYLQFYELSGLILGFCRRRQAPSGKAAAAFLFSAGLSAVYIFTALVAPKIINAYLPLCAALFPGYVILIIFLILRFALKTRSEDCAAYIIRFYGAVCIMQIFLWALESGLSALFNRAGAGAVGFVLSDAISKALCITIFYVSGFVFKRTRMYRRGIREVIVTREWHTIFGNLLPIGLLYCSAVLLLSADAFINRETGGIFFFVMNMLFSWLSLNLNSKSYYKRLSAEKGSQMELLLSSYDDIRKFQHDITNMLQVYEGYIGLEDFKSLKEYHTRLFGMGQSNSSVMHISGKFNENPAFYSVLISKIRMARNAGVRVHASCAADLSRLSVHPIDISRIMGILLDNAIYEAELSEAKEVDISTAQGADNVLKISVRNPTCGYVDVNKIILEGYSTKNGHMGVGLAEVMDIADKSSDLAFDMKYADNMMTVILSSPADDARSENFNALKVFSA